MKYEIPKLDKPQHGRRIAIGDIHGCADTFQLLLRKLAIQQEDQLFLLGDLIDKGTRSKEVIDAVLALQNEGYQLFPIRGNHEQAFLNAYHQGFDFFMEYLAANNTEDFLDDDIEAYLTYFSNFEYCYDLGDWLACHSEFLVNERSIYRGMRGMFSRIDFQIADEVIVEKRQITGHFVTTTSQIEASIKNKNKVIFLDSGCVYAENEELGYLAAFDLDAEELFLQKNVEKILEIEEGGIA